VQASFLAPRRSSGSAWGVDPVSNQVVLAAGRRQGARGERSRPPLAQRSAARVETLSTPVTHLISGGDAI
jgi:hypothetical protein